MRTRSTGARPTRGYSLVELLAALAVAAIAAALALPSVASLSGGQSVERAAHALLMDLRLAQWRAVVSGRRVRLVPGPGADGGWGYRVEREAEPSTWSPEGEPVKLPRGVALQAAGSPAKVFNPDGTCSAGSLSLAGPAGRRYRYTLSPATGRIRFYRGDQEAARGP